MIEGKNIVLGITGGIAAYKSAELTRELIKQGGKVHVIMTENATRFITPLTLQTLSGNPVYCDTFTLTGDWEIGHISLAEKADAIIIAPATANVIGKIAAGIADDLLTTTVMATRAPVLICPAMNTQMYTNPIVEENMKKLAGLGYDIMEAEQGELACKTDGPGRLPAIAGIVEAVEKILTEKDLTGQCVLVTAGPTNEPIDPVRYITNHSSGKMGYAIAVQAQRRGADVVLISGPTALPVPEGLTFVGVSNAREMHDRVMEYAENATVIVKAAAVADYRPAVESASKLKKRRETMTLSLERNPDIIAELGARKGNRVLVGFAMETEDLERNARDKLCAKNMDFIVANNLSEEGAGFRYDTNMVTVLYRDGSVESLPMMSKMEVAATVLDRIQQIIDGE